ncbi:hypothetical protein CHS0354_032372 [Potamilus streckersoni]|uniref:Phosphatidylinositol glycan anchor biosynthesis class U protein n=1 Tax=Potamilus streckersoni TaxID=2493646 RepID=A0AAE0THF4_9BIVA|nr:hypothetical protein CHS0354_032372 [Potamilus streckersoni]
MEGVALSNSMISPYSGDLFHETPLMLRFLDFATRAFPNAVNYLFVFVDMLSAIVLMKIGNLFARYLLQKQVNDIQRVSTKAEKIIIRKASVEDLHLYLAAAHLFNPYSVAVCLGKSTAVFNNLAIYFSFLFLLQGNELVCLFSIAMATYQSLYPLTLLAPVALYFYTVRNPKKVNSLSPDAVNSYVRTTVLGLLSITGLVAISYILEGSTKFLYSTYGFVLSVPDLTPNLGVFWYFFTEMFEHFRTFFICVFQIHAFIYVVPLSIRLRDHPVFLMYILVVLMSIFKSYPSYADVALLTSLLPLWKHTFSYMRNKFVVTNMFVCCAVFGPILYHLWIYAGSANANFYFSIALAFSSAEVFLATDLLFAYLRREFDLKHGIEQKLENGKTAQVTLE